MNGIRMNELVALRQRASSEATADGECKSERLLSRFDTFCHKDTPEMLSLTHRAVLQKVLQGLVLLHEMLLDLEVLLDSGRQESTLLQLLGRK